MSVGHQDFLQYIKYNTTHRVFNIFILNLFGLNKYHNGEMFTRQCFNKLTLKVRSFFALLTSNLFCFLLSFE